MSEFFFSGERLPITTGFLEMSGPRGTDSSLSSHFFSDANLSASFQNFMENDRNELPFLSGKTKELLTGADALSISSAVDNKASGEEPDFRLVLGTDGKLRLEPTKVTDPLSDGKLNIEIDTKNKSLVEAIKQSDANLKEFIREMIAYWIKNHPGKDYPSWWDELLAETPYYPQDASPPRFEMTPAQFRPPVSTLPEPPAAPQTGWQPDYRGGGGQGYSTGGSGRGSDYYHGGGNGSQNYSLPNQIPNFDDSGGFIDRLAKAIMKNEGALDSSGQALFTAYNPDDNGGISVGLRQWHAGGALPELLNAWQENNPQKFQTYFHGYSPAQINAMSSSEFASHPELVDGMKNALADSDYQGIQMQLITDWVKREVKMGLDIGLTGERELAVFVDIANQYGQDSANQAALIGQKAGDQGEAMNSSVRGSQYAERFAFINNNFSTQRVDLVERVPAAGEFGQRLAEAVKAWDNRMSGTGACAAAVQRALADLKLPQFVGSGNAWDMLSPLERSGLFVKVPESQAAVGDIILRPPSSNPNDDSIYGDISVVTAKHGNTIVQTNDATYEFVKNNPRYDSQAVFLRYVGDESAQNRLSAQTEQLPKKDSNKATTANSEGSF